MNKSKLLFISLTSITTGILIAIIVAAFNNPTGNPTTGGYAYTYTAQWIAIGY